MQVEITNRNIEVAIKSFRKKSQKENIVKEARRRKAYEKPSENKKRKKDESLQRKWKIRREGYAQYKQS